MSQANVCVVCQRIKSIGSLLIKPDGTRVVHVMPDPLAAPGSRSKTRNVLGAWQAGGVISLSVVRMFKQMFGAIKYAAREEGFVAILGAAILLVVTGTVAYSLAEGWSVVDGFYFAISTLTTSSIADPDLMLTSDAIKVFTAFYVLTGIGILVEVARQIGFGYVAMRSDRGADRRSRRGKEASPPEK